MPEGKNAVVAIHYYYLLKSNEKSLGETWSLLLDRAGGEAEKQEPPGSLAGETGEHCRIVKSADGRDFDLRLAVLPGLAVVEAVYRDGTDGDLAAHWRGALKRLDGDRERVLTGGVSLFGETTLLVAGDRSEDEVKSAALEAAGAGKALVSHLNPEVAGDGKPLLLFLPGAGGEKRDYYALAAAATDTIVFTTFPELASLIRKIDRSASYFEVQRNTITDERSDTDRQVGSLLHRQVVAGKEASKTPEKLEQQVNDLSKMYGVLATDSLLIRNSQEQLETELRQYGRTFGALLSPGGKDETGSYFASIFNTELEAIRDEIRNLDFSRENARAAIEIVRTEVELLRAGEDVAIQSQTRELLLRSLTLQQERMALRVAATFVEFVLVFYYVLKSWESIAGGETFNRIPALLRILVVALIAGGTAMGTHYVAQAIQHRNLKESRTGIIIWLSVAVAALLLAATIMVIVTVTSSQ